jgi:6-phosphofructokinase 1
MRRLLVVTGGGDCPGLNAVIRGVVKRSAREREWEVFGSIKSYNGVLSDPQEIVPLDIKTVTGIHLLGGTILRTINKGGGPFSWPVKKQDGSWHRVDRSDELIQKLQKLGIDAVISIGGDGSQRISQGLFEKGLSVVGVPKTIDNDLGATDFTFGFQTAVQIATEAVDNLLTTAASHSRLIILEVMGRNAGWIALSAAIAGGADMALIPEFPYDIKKVLENVRAQMQDGKGFAVIVVAEGAKPKEGSSVYQDTSEMGYREKRLGGIAEQLSQEIKKNLDVDIRTVVLGHLQRGAEPIAFDRILAAEFGVKAFEMVLEGKFGTMVAYQHPNIISVPIAKAIAQYKMVSKNDTLVHTARALDISLGI